MSLRFEILKILGDGRFHSGATLGARLGASRTAVWKHLHALSAWGLDVYAVPGKGYRLAQPLELLTREGVLPAVAPAAHALLADLEVHPHIDSTNSHLMRRAAAGLASGHACLAEYQSAGRGRRGRHWISPFGSNIYLSVLWRFSTPPAQLSGVGLAMGVAVARALRTLGVTDASLKWPNDILWQGRKLAGTLLEMSAESNGPCAVVVGVGLNTAMSAAAAGAIDQAWADLEQALGEPVPRHRIAGLLLSELLLALQSYERAGLNAFLPEWRALDDMTNRAVRLQLPHATIEGVARGIDDQGALLLECNGATRRYAAGEVSLRPLAMPPTSH